MNDMGGVGDERQPIGDKTARERKRNGNASTREASGSRRALG